MPMRRTVRRDVLPRASAVDAAAADDDAGATSSSACHSDGGQGATAAGGAAAPAGRQGVPGGSRQSTGAGKASLNAHGWARMVRRRMHACMHVGCAHWRLRKGWVPVCLCMVARASSRPCCAMPPGWAERWSTCVRRRTRPGGHTVGMPPCLRRLSASTQVEPAARRPPHIYGPCGLQLRLSVPPAQVSVHLAWCMLGSSLRACMPGSFKRWLLCRTYVRAAW